MIHRHVSPAEHRLALGPDESFDDLFAACAVLAILRQKGHAHAVVAFGWKIDAVLSTPCPQKRVGQLDENPGPVAGQGVGTYRAAMGEILQQGQTLPDDMMTFMPFNVSDEANAARIVFMSRVVETLLGRYRKLTHRLTSVGWYRDCAGGSNWLRRNSNHRAIPTAGG